MLPSPARFSPAAGFGPAVPPSAKLPNDPIGEKPPPCEVDQEEAEVFAPAAKLPVALLFNPPKGGPDSQDLSLSFSSGVEPDSCSLKSVLRRRRAGGGVAAFNSSLEKREEAGEA